jgi:diguanylate cyclase (GGDEF)-like protein
MTFGKWFKRSGVAARPAAPRVVTSSRARQGLLDLAKRADRGTFVHVPLWILIATGSGLLTNQPLFCLVNGLIFVANVAAKLIFRPHFEALVEDDCLRAHRIYMALLLWNCVHWGVLVAAAMHYPALQPAEEALLATVVGVGCCGALGLAISPFVRLWYPACVFAPMSVAMLADRTPSHTLLALMTLVLVAYLYKTSQVVHDDYWQATDARLELEARASQLELLSVTDALTQIHNRLYFEHRLVAEWSRAAREALPLSILIVDLDHFKEINDSYGHPFGDRCLNAAAQALRAGLHRGGDVLARYGGEEFAVLLPGTEAADALRVAERLLQCVAKVELTHEGRAVRLTCSIGVSTLMPAPLSHPASAIGEADKALYLAKQQGRNRVVVSSFAGAHAARSEVA